MFLDFKPFLKTKLTSTSINFIVFINPNYPTVYKSKPIFKERFLPSKQI